MNLNDLVGKTFTEDEIFELLVFEVEENFQSYLGKHCHLNLELLEKVLKVTVIEEIKNEDDLHQLNRKKFDKKEWIYLSDNFGHIDIVLIRKDRTNRIGIVYENRATYTHNWGSYYYLDE